MNRAEEYVDLHLDAAPHGFVVERFGAQQDPGARRRQGDLLATLDV